MLCRRYLYVILRSLGVKIANEIDISWMTGGKQGSGIDVALGLFSRTMIRYGYHIYGYREYHSNIIGMHSYFIVRTTEAEKNSLGGKVDLAVFSIRNRSSAKRTGTAKQSIAAMSGT